MPQTCTSIDPLVTPYVDDELTSAERALVDDHLRRCAPCYRRVASERAVRDLVRAHKETLTSAVAPDALRERCGEAAEAGPHASATPMSRVPVAALPPARRRWSAVALAAALVLVVGGAFLYVATDRSARVMAAELTADHVKCFGLDELLATHQSASVVESSMLSGFGWNLRLPAQLERMGFELVGARPCLYGEGRVAHLMYRLQGQPISIFMLPKSARREELVEVFGHEAAIWPAEGHTFVLITRGARAEIQKLAASVKACLQ